MRTLVDIPDGQLKELTRISEKQKVSRAAVIREAIASYLANAPSAEKPTAFGLWGDHEIDGLEYQKKLRAEW
jgi:metal-responsive CopG/Arc/MetJ family transcriptional regulator